MKDFIQAALPWIVMGIAIIIFFVSHDKKKKQKELSKNKDCNDKEDDTYMIEGMAVGMCLGSSLGATGIFDIGVGIGVGMLIGLAIGSCIKKPK